MATTISIPNPPPATPAVRAPQRSDTPPELSPGRRAYASIDATEVKQYKAPKPGDLYEMLENYGDIVRMGVVDGFVYTGALDKEGSCLAWTAVVRFGDKTLRKISHGQGWRSAADPHPALLRMDPDAHIYRIDGEGKRHVIGQGPRLVLIADDPQQSAIGTAEDVRTAPPIETRKARAPAAQA